MASLERTHFWGCTLTKEKPIVKWQGTEENDDNEVDVLNQLALSQACLGPKTKGEATHVIQVTTKGIKNDTITQPIIVLGAGVEQIQCRLEFTTQATFKLIEGPGPVYLAGSHVQVLSSDYNESEDESEDEGISTAKESSVNGTAMINPSPSKQPPVKRAKLELENDKEEDSTDDEEEDSDDKELLKPDPKKVSPVKEKPAGDKKTPQKVTSPAKKGNTNLIEKEAEEGSEESDEMDDSEDEEDDNDEDFEGDDSEDDDDDDDDDNDDDDDDESDESEISENDITNAITTKNKLRNEKKGLERSATTEKKTPEKNASNEKKTPKKGNMDASVPLQKTPDIASVKQKLLKSTNLPKKMDKFKNFMKANVKVTDEKTIKDLWTWLQKTKK